MTDVVLLAVSLYLLRQDAVRLMHSADGDAWQYRCQAGLRNRRMNTTNRSG
jgi:hypothetical protein